MDEYDLDPENAHRECRTLAGWGCTLAMQIVAGGMRTEAVRAWWLFHRECSVDVCGRAEGQRRLRLV